MRLALPYNCKCFADGALFKSVFKSVFIFSMLFYYTIFNKTDFYNESLMYN